MSGAPIGLWKRIAAFFEANPDEELTKEDMMAKFGASEHSVVQALWRLKGDGTVDRHVVYRAAQPTSARAHVLPGGA